MSTQLKQQINYNYSTGGVYQGKLYIGDTVVGYFDTSPSMNVDLVWDDNSGQFLIQALFPMLADVDATEVQGKVYKMLKRGVMRK